ncbi:TPA: CCA tRNA nucleotidyltransferase, partial [Enterococcus faecium]|nr:CCA tRNA nucleotidyltransferase [Enterococcus faecium]
LPSVPLKEESQAWALLISQLDLKENEIRSFLKSWKCSNQMIKDVQALVQGLRQRETGALEPFELYFLGKKHALQVEELMIYFDETPQMDAVGESYDRLPIKSLSELAVDGKILLEETGKKPGKWVSEALQLAEKAVVEQRIKNDKKQVLDFLSKEKLI